MWLLPGISVSFLSGPEEIARAYASSYDLTLVATSVLIAVFASFCALETVSRMSQGGRRHLWVALGAVLLGLGIWAMHFIGMIAFRLQCGVRYDFTITLLSMIPGMIAAGVALQLIARNHVSLAAVLFAGGMLGGGIGLMHYSGMAAIQLEGVLRYDPVLFACSILAAVGLAIPALRAKFLVRRFRIGHLPYVPSLIGGGIMGLSISSMHYIAMEAAYFIPQPDMPAVIATNPTTLATLVGSGVLLLLFLGMLFTFFGDRIARVRHRMESVLATTSQGFVMMDRDGHITEANPAMLQLAGVDAAALIGQPFANLLPEADRAHLQEASFQFESGLLRGEGNPLPCLIHGNHLRDSDDRRPYSFALITDISARVAAENRAQAREQQFRALLDSTPDPMIIVNQQGRIAMVNQQAERMFGYTREDMVGQLVEMLMPQRLRQSHTGLRDDFLHHGQARTMGNGRDLMAVTRDGREFPVEISLSPIHTSEGLLVASALRDITQRKEYEALLTEAKHAAEEATQMKSDFLANMSHEIRTPMNAIIGISHLALKTDLSERQRDYLNKIQQSGQHLLGIINDILDFSKIEAGKMTVESVEFDLEQVLANCSHLIQDKANTKGLELVFDVAADVPLSLIGDPLRLGQILINFGTNAVKFTEHGEIDIVVRKQEDAGDEVVLHFSVRDTGIGLSAEQVANLFQSFQQADASTTRKYGGTGLGLAISKHLTELMHGEIGVESQPGKGSTFWFTARLGKGHHARHLLPDPDLRGRRVLVVDDNENARTVLADMLAGMTFVVDNAAGGAEAVTRVRNAAIAGKPYELVFIDWMMPSLDGFATARQIRSLGLSPTPRLLLVTAYGREDVMSGARSNGLDEVLVKPVNASLLFDTVMSLLGAPHDIAQESGAMHASLATDGQLPDLKTIAGRRVLLVEDNDLNQMVAQELLQEAGLVVDVADNGAVAIEKVQQHPYDLVLMDMQMPVMDGITATQEIRRLPEFSTLPIVAMTANAMQQDKEKCLAAGMNDHLAKPIDPYALWHTLLQWIPGSPSATPALSPDATADVTAAAPAPTIPDRIPGLDTALGLTRVMGNQALYVSVLGKFLAGQRDAIAQIETALAAGDLAKAERLAHTLKGVAGNIGAADLQAQAGRLEQALRDGAPRAEADRHLAATSALLAPLLAALQQALPGQSPLDSVTLDTESLSRLLQQLTSLLADDDAESAVLFTAHAGELRAAFPEIYNALERSVHSFDFELTISLIKESAGRRGIAL